MTNANTESQKNQRALILLGLQRFNWMSYNGTDSEELNVMYLRALKNLPGFADYQTRQATIEEIRQRLLAIKSDLGILSEEELRAEEEARQRRRQERAERRRLEQEEAERRAREAEDRAAEEEKRRLAAEDYARRWAALQEQGHLTEEAEARRCALLEGLERSQSEIDSAVVGVTFGARSLLLSTNSGYVSYLDGSMHTSVSRLNAYNVGHLESTRFALRHTTVSLPPASQFNTITLENTIAAREQARKNLDACRATRGPNGDEASLLAAVVTTKAKAEAARVEYNKSASACAHHLQKVACSTVEARSATAEEDL